MANDSATFRVEALLSDQLCENLVEQTVSILKEEGSGYGLTVSGDNPVFVQAVKEGGPADRAGVRPGDRILMVNDRCVSKLGHVEVVQLIKATKLVNLRLLGRKTLKTSSSLPILSQMTKQDPLDRLISRPLDPTARDKQRTVELKSSTLERMLKQEQQFYKDRCNEYTRSPSTQLEKEIQDSSGRISTLEKQLTSEEAEQPLQKPDPVVSQASTTSEEPSSAAMASTERHPVATGSRVSTKDVEGKKITLSGKRKKSHSQSGDKKSGGLRLHGSKGSQSTESLTSKSKKMSLTSLESSSSVALNNGHVVGAIDENQAYKSVSSLSEASQDSVSNICIDASDEDEGLDDDSKGPFSDLSLLERSPAHLAVFLNFLISKSSHNPNNLFFYLISGVYQRHHGNKELKRMANELYLTFLHSTAPLKLDIDQSLRKQIESTLKLKSSSDESLRSVFIKAREYVYVLVSQQLSGFRSMRTLGLGSMFGDTVLSDGHSKHDHIEIVGQLLLPHLQHLAVSRGEESAEKRSKREATASCLAVFLQDIGVKMKLRTDSSNRLSSFVNSAKLSKSSSIFKNKKVHVINGHEFVANHYHYPTFCDHCGGLLWGLGFQGYQCQVCGFNVHKQSCNTDLTGECEGPGRKAHVRIGSLWVDLNKRKGTNIKRDKSSRQSSEAEIPPLLALATNHEDGFVKKEDEESDASSLLKAGSVRDGRVTSLVKSYEQKTALATPAILANGKRLSACEGMDIEEELERTLMRSRGSSICVSHTLERPQKEKKGQVQRTRSLKLQESEKNRLSLNRFAGGTDHSVSMINLRDDDSVIDETGRSQRSPSREEQEILQDEDMAVSETLIPWIELADKSVWKDMSPGEIKRQEVMHELFHTEKTHLKKLKTIYYVFYVPLQLSRLVTAEKVEQLFPKLTKIIEIHGYVVQGMRDRWTECYQQRETPGCLTSIGDIMLSLFDSQLGDALIEACSEFVSNQTASLEFIKTMRSKSKEFDRLIQRCEANPLCSRLQISELMSVVMTRLTRYPLLLEKLLKYTDENDPDYGDVESALEASRDALAEVNVHMTLAENQQFLKEIQRKLDTSPLEKGSLQLEEIKNFSLIAEGRDLVYDGHLGWKTVKNRTTNTYAVLLSDMLVLLEHNEDKDRYILKPRPDPSIKSDMYRSPIITFRDFLVRDVATDSKAFFVLSTSSGGPQMHELVAHSMSERETWIMKLKETANSWKYAQKGASAGQRVLLDRRHRYSTPEKLIEPANVSDSEKDSLDMEHETADQIQERLRQRTDFIASSLERKAALLQRLQETCSDKSDQSEVNNSTQPERKDSVEEASLGMRHRILSCLDQGDVVTGFVNQLVYYEETLEKDEKDAKIHQKNLLVLQDLLSATAALNRRLGKLLELEMPDDLSLSLPERENSIEKRPSLQRPRSHVISECRKNSTESPPLYLELVDSRTQSPPFRQRISPAILELQQTIEQQLTPTSSPVLERRKSATPLPQSRRKDAVGTPAVSATAGLRRDAVDAPAVDATIVPAMDATTALVVDEATVPASDSTVNSNETAISNDNDTKSNGIDGESGETSGQTEGVNSTSMLQADKPVI